MVCKAFFSFLPAARFDKREMNAGDERQSLFLENHNLPIGDAFRNGFPSLQQSDVATFGTDDAARPACGYARLLLVFLTQSEIGRHVTLTKTCMDTQSRSGLP